MKSRIAIGYIEPLKVSGILIPTPPPPKDVMVDLKHPITMALMEKLPKLDEVGLKALKKHMEDHNFRVNAMSSKQDVDSWTELVDEEIAHRKREQYEALHSLLDVLSKPFLQRG